MANGESSSGLPPFRSTLADHPDIRHLIPVFVARMTGYVKDLCAFVAAGDSVALQHLAHQLKGAGRSYGFGPISTHGSQIEEGLRAGRTVAEVQPFVDALVGYMRNVEGFREDST